MKRQFERVTCPGCGRKVAAYVPYMGDGSGLRMPPHAIVDPAKVRTRSVPCYVGGRIIVRGQGKWELET